MHSVKVAIRIRPLIAREKGSEILWAADTHQIKVKDGKKDPYIFDRVFESDETTGDVYEEIVEPIVESAMTGFNGTVFAYGQTSSGKTYTMMGDSYNPGIIPLSVRDTFAHIQKTPEREFLLRVCYMEIYNEVVRDLLVSSSDSTGLQIREDEFRNAVVQGLTEKVVASEDEVLGLVRQGDKRRHTGCTNMNERSSRSHTIFRMILESRERVDPNNTTGSVESDTAVKISQLNLVDLAGSERAHQTGAEGQRFKEGCHINKSLSTLGLVINQICKASESGQSVQFISYRDSKLTRILQPSLGGNSLTAIICAVTPVSYEDTDSTLRFASNAKKIKNKPHVNEVLSDEALLYRQKREINQLKKKIHELELNAGKKKNEELETMLIQKETLQKEQEEKIAVLKKIILVSTQPVDTAKRQRNIRRETWCPGKLTASVGGVARWGSPTRDRTLSAQPARDFDSVLQLDQNFLGVEFEPIMKRARTVDNGGSSMDPLDSKKEADAASEHFASLEDELILMQKKQEELKEELTNTTLEKDSALKEKDSLKLKVMRMQEEMESQRENLNDVFDEKSQIEAQNDELIEKIKNQNARITDYMRRETQWLNSNPNTASLQNENMELRDQLSEVCSQKCQLMVKNDEHQDSLRSLQNQLHNVTTDLKEKEDSLEEYKNQISSLQSQLEATFSSTKSQSSISVPENKPDELKSLREDLQKKCQEIASMKEELSEKINPSDMDDILKQVEQLSAENHRLKLMIEDLKEASAGETSANEVESLKLEIARLNELAKEKDAASSCPDKEDAMNESARIGNKTFNEYVSTCDEMVEKLIVDKEMLQKQNDELKLQIGEKFGEITMENAVAEFEKVVQEKESALQKIQRLNEEIEQLRLKNQHHNQRIHSLIESKEFLDMEKEVFSQQEKEHEEKIEALENEIIRLKSHNVIDKSNNQDRDTKQLLEEIDILKKSSHDAQTMLQQANKDLAVSMSTVETQKQEMDTMQKDLKRVQSDLDSFNCMSEITKDKYERRIEELSRQLQSTYDEIGGTEKPDGVQNNSPEIDEYKIRLDEKESEIDRLKKQIADTSVELEDMRLSVEHYKKWEESLNHDSQKENSEDVANFLVNIGMNLEEVKEKLSTIDELQQKTKELMMDLELQSSKILSLENILKDGKENSDSDLSEKIAQLENMIKEKDARIEEIQLSSEQHIKNLETTQAAETEHGKEISAKKLKELRDLSAGKEEIIAELRNELEKSTSKQEELDKQLEITNSVPDDERKVRDLLTDTRKELADMTERYNKLNTITQHAQGALLAETNRDFHQQKQLRMAETLRRESALEIASERESANKQINQLLSKVGELQTSLSRADVEKELAARDREKATQECEFLRQQVKNLEKIHRDETSIVPRGQIMDPDKMAARIKQLSMNLELTVQIQNKLKTTNATLTDENKKLEREAIKVIELQADVARLKGILEQESQARLDCASRQNDIQKQADSMRERIVELGKQLKDSKHQQSVEADKFAAHFDVCEQNKNSLRAENEKSLNRIKELDSKIAQLVQKEDEYCTIEKHSKEAMEKMKVELEEVKSRKVEDERSINSLNDRLDHTIRALEQAKKNCSEQEENHSALMRDMQKISDELDDKRKLIDELQEKNALLLQSLEKMNEKLASKDEEIENVRNEVCNDFLSTQRDSEKNLEDMRKILSDVEQEKDSYIKKIEDLQKSFGCGMSEKDETLKKSAEEQNKLNDDKHELANTILEYERKLSENKEIIEETKLSLSSKIHDIEILLDENNSLKEKISILNSGFENKEEDLESKTSYNILKEQYDEVNREKEILLEKIRELEISIVLKEDEYNSQPDSNKFEEFTEKMSILEDELENAIMDKETAHGSLEETTQEHEKVISDLQKIIEEKDSEIAAFKESGIINEGGESMVKKLDDLKCELAEKQDEIARCRNELKALKSCDKKNVSVSEYGMEFTESLDQELFDQLYEEVAELKIQLQEKEEVIQSMNVMAPSQAVDEKMAIVQQESENLRSQIAAMARDIESKDEEIVILQDRCKASNATVEETSVEHIKADDEDIKADVENITAYVENIKADDEDIKANVGDTKAEDEDIKADVGDIKADGEDDMNDSIIPGVCSDVESQSHTEKLTPDTTSDSKQEESSSMHQMTDSELEILRRRNIKQSEKITKLTSLLEAQRKEMVAVKNQLLDLGISLESENSRILKLKQAKNDAEVQLMQLQKENGELRQTLANAKESVSSMNDEKSPKEYDVKLAELMKQLEQSNEARDEAIRQGTENDEKLERLEAELESHQILIEKFQECESSMKAAQETVHSLEQQLEDHESQKQKESQEMKDKITDYKNLTQELNEKLENHHELEKEVQRLKNETDIIEMKMEELEFAKNLKIQELENLLQVKEEEYSSDKNSLESEISRHKQEVSVMKTNLNSIYAVIEEKAAIMEQSAASRDALENDVEELKQENMKLKSKLVEFDTQQFSTSAQFSDDIKKAEERIDDLLHNISQLENTLDSVKKENDKYEKESTTLEKEIMEAVDKIQELQSEVDSLKCTNESLVNEKRKRENSERRTKDSEILIVSLRDEVKMMQEMIESLKTRITEITEETTVKEEMLNKDWEENRKILEEKLSESECTRDAIQQALEVAQAKTKSIEDSYSSVLEEERESQRILTFEIVELKRKLASAVEEKTERDVKVENLKTQLRDLTETHKREISDQKNTEIESLHSEIEAKEMEMKKRLEEIQGILYKKELEVQTLQSELLKWERCHQEDKLEMENAIKLAKEEISTIEQQNYSRIKDLEGKLALVDQIKQNLQKKVNAAEELEATYIETSKKQKAEHDSEISKMNLKIASIEEDFQKKLLTVEKTARDGKMRLQDKIDEYEQALFEEDRDLENEKDKTNSLEKKIEELEKCLKTALKSAEKGASSSKMKELYQKLEAKCAEEKKKSQSAETQLCVEKQRNMQLSAKLQEYERNIGSDVDVARELLTRRQKSDAYEEKLKKMEVDFEKKLKEKVERLLSTKKLLGDRVNQLEDSCIESELELDEEKKKNNGLQEKIKALEEQLKSQLSSSSENQERNLKKELQGKESEVSRLQIQLKLCKEPLERENGQLKDELKLCEDRIENLKQQVKLAAGSESAEKNQTRGGRVTRSSASMQKPTSQAGVVRESRMYILEMEISDNQHRIQYLEKELAKYKDIETRRRSENVELLEENNKYRSLIKKAREKKSGSTEILTENTAILNEASGALPKTQDDKCKNQ